MKFSEFVFWMVIMGMGCFSVGITVGVIAAYHHIKKRIFDMTDKKEEV